jgi:hypothetical protein
MSYTGNHLYKTGDELNSLFHSLLTEHDGIRFARKFFAAVPILYQPKEKLLRLCIGNERDFHLCICTAGG